MDVSKELDFLHHLLIVCNVEDNRGRTAPQREDQRTTRSSNVLDHFSRPGTEF